MAYRTLLLLIIVGCAATLPFAPLRADEQEAAPPLHERIDALLEAGQTGPATAPADDPQFLRRVMLDLAGRIPSVDELRDFLADEAPDKRQRKIDELLAGPEFPRHMAVTFELMLMERRSGSHVKTEQFREYLRKAFEKNTPFHTLAAEILAADGTEEKNRAASGFYLERDVEPNLLTREIGRVFFGIDLQCAQCHDHPLIDDYHQSDYYGLFAFVGRVSLFQPDNKKPALVAEKAEGEAFFKSVFTEREGETGPRLPGGEELVEPVLKENELYEVAPEKNVRPIPTYSRIEKLSEEIGKGDNREFARNIANRLWAHLFGRGLVHPVDRHHSDNPPAHPELLDLLAEEIIRIEYDVPAFLRELALTDAYQRSFQLPEDLTPSIETAREEIARLEAKAEELEQQALSANARVFDETMELDEAVAEVKPVREAVKSADAALAEAKKKQTEADQKLAEANKAVEAKQAQVEVVQTAVASSKKAAETLAEDKELATAAETIQKKSDALAGELAKLQEQAKTDRQAAEEAKQGVAAATTSAQEAADRLAQAEQQVRGLRDKLLASRKEAESNRSLAVHARREVTALETLIAYGEQKTRIAQLRESIPETETQLAQAEKQMQEATQTLSAKKTAAEEADKQLAAARKSLQQAEGKRADTGTTAKLLEESLAKATEAKSRLKESEELEQAVATLTQTVESMRSVMQEQEKQVGQRKQDLEKKTKAMESAQAEVATAEQELKSHSEQVAERKQSLASAREELESVTQANRESWKQIVDQTSHRFQVAAVVSLTPEQLGLSVLQATGQADRQRASEKAKLDKEKPLSEEDQKDAEKRAQREREIDEATYAALSKTVNGVFVKLFAAAQGQPQDEFFATAEQALFFANGDEVRSWLNPGGGNLTERLLKLEDSGEFAEELYLSIFSRMPKEQEVRDVDEYLQSRPDEREQAVTELAWALLTSAEFRFQH